MTAYYNEIDAYAAQWLRNLIAAGHIAPGDVDERDIRDVRPDDLKGYTQCHFFAGIGVWSHALRLAGWPDDRPVWTGSCPCQPFSAAGRRGGTSDERHLWPAFFHLVGECRPASLFGEQVASKDGLGWLDLVQADMEGAGYAFGASDLCVAGFGGPHIRQRLFFGAERLADAVPAGRSEGWARPRRGSSTRGGRICGVAHNHGNGCDTPPVAELRDEKRDAEPCGGVVGLADANDTRPQGWLGMSERPDQCASGPRGLVGGLADTGSELVRRERREGISAAGTTEGETRQWQRGGSNDRASGSVGGLANSPERDQQRHSRDARSSATPSCSETRPPHGNAHRSASGLVPRQPRPTDGFWRAADWLFCRDGKWRPVEPSTSPLAHGAPSRVGRLRAYGNAISPYPAKAFIESFDEACRDARRVQLEEMDVFS